MREREGLEGGGCAGAEGLEEGREEEEGEV